MAAESPGSTDLFSESAQGDPVPVAQQAVSTPVEYSDTADASQGAPVSGRRRESPPRTSAGSKPKTNEGRPKARRANQAEASKPENLEAEGI